MDPSCPYSYPTTSTHPEVPMASIRKPGRASGNVFSATCPSRTALELVSSKWALLIVPMLVDGRYATMTC